MEATNIGFRWSVVSLWLILLKGAAGESSIHHPPDVYGKGDVVARSYLRW